MKPDASDRRPIHHSPIFWVGIVMCLAPSRSFCGPTTCRGGQPADRPSLWRFLGTPPAESLMQSSIGLAKVSPGSAENGHEPAKSRKARDHTQAGQAGSQTQISSRQISWAQVCWRAQARQAKICKFQIRDGGAEKPASRRTRPEHPAVQRNQGGAGAADGNGRHLKVIASSPSDVQPVFDAIASSAKRLIGSFSAAVYRYHDGVAHMAAFTPTNPAADEVLRNSFPRPIAESAFPLTENGKPAQVVDTSWRRNK